MINYNFIITIFCVTLITSCNKYGVNKERDFKIIENHLYDNLKVNSIEIIDNENLLINLKSPFIENQDSFENFASVAQYIIGKNYKPNVLNIGKNIIIKMIDKSNNNFETKTNFNSIFYLEKFFDKTLSNLQSILNADYNGEEYAIVEFHKTNCFKKINVEEKITSANIVGIKKINLDEVKVIINVNGKEQHYLEIDYRNSKLDTINCLIIK